jgi:hypothetical protein
MHFNVARAFAAGRRVALIRKCSLIMSGAVAVRS